MSAYNGAHMLSQHSPTHGMHMMSQYPPPPGSPSPTNVPFAPAMYPTTDPALQPTPQHHHTPVAPHPTQPSPISGRAPNSEGREVKNRLPRACDLCSSRKVKCDEQVPCKACVALKVECTFQRPTKRRGPPNRHAEMAKRQKLEAEGGDNTSPTHAAHALAAFSQQQRVMSADRVLPFNAMKALTEDYFDLVYPVIPVPNAQKFRANFDQRGDEISPVFCAVVTSVVGVFVATFPRRALARLSQLGYAQIFPNSKSLIDHCNAVAMEAVSANLFAKPTSSEETAHRAVVFYLQGLAKESIGERDECLDYFRQCSSILARLKPSKYPFANRKPGALVPKMVTNGQATTDSSDSEELMVQELSRRTYWLLLGAVQLLYQVGTSPTELPPMLLSKDSTVYPPFPLEQEDDYLEPTLLQPPPADRVSMLTGFNVKAQIYNSSPDVLKDTLSESREMTETEAKVQKKNIRHALAKVKKLIDRLPPHYRINSDASAGVNGSLHSPDSNNPTDPAHGSFGLLETSKITSLLSPIEIQKAEIHASQLATRFWLVRHSRAVVIRLKNDNDFDMDMTIEGYDILTEFLQLLKQLNQVTMEASGALFVRKIHSISLKVMGMYAGEGVISDDGSSAKGKDKEKDGTEKRDPFTLPPHKVFDNFHNALNGIQFPFDGATSGSEEADHKLAAWTRFIEERDNLVKAAGL